jgi:hypothetical protein
MKGTTQSAITDLSARLLFGVMLLGVLIAMGIGLAQAR